MEFTPSYPLALLVKQLQWLNITYIHT